MDASEYKEFIFGLLFIKRLSDEFDVKRQILQQRDYAHLKNQPEILTELLEDKDSYGETFLCQNALVGMKVGQMKQVMKSPTETS